MNFYYKNVNLLEFIFKCCRMLGFLLHKLLHQCFMAWKRLTRGSTGMLKKVAPTVAFSSSILSGLMLLIIILTVINRFCLDFISAQFAGE